MQRGAEVHEALEAALNSEGSRERSHFQQVEPQRNDHSRERVRRLLMRVIGELPEDMTIMELREALDE